MSRTIGDAVQIDLRRGRMLLLPVAAVLILAACGNGNSSGGGGRGSEPARSASGAAVAVHDGVLTDARGRTVYVSDQENGAVLCSSGACTSVWIPLTLPGGGQPSGPSQVAGELGTVERPDGSRQLALDGKPLYTFSFDHAAGQRSGDGKRDSFDGTRFTWHAATVGGARTGPAPSTPAGTGYGY